MAIKLYDLVKVTTATTGTGPLTLGSAVSGFLTFSGGGVQDGETVRYGIRDGANSEIGYGVYTASGTALTRNVTASTNGNAAIDLSGTAQVFICASSLDLTNIPIWNKPIPPSGSVGLVALANVCPQMTSNSSGGAVASASSNYSGTPSYQAFTNSRLSAGGWITNGSSTGWVAIQLPASKTIYGYGIIGWSADTFPYRIPKTWTFEGSNNGSTWTTLDTRTNLWQETWIRWGEKFFQLSAPATYLYYRLNVSANNGDGYMGVQQLILYGEVDPPANGYVSLFIKTPAGDLFPVSRVFQTLG